MPIRESELARYPKDRPQISIAIRERADGKCEGCGVENYAYGGRSPDGRFWRSLPTGTNGMRLTWPQIGTEAMCDGWPEPLRIIRIVLTVSHLDHQPENCAPENLKALCQRCHLRYDATMKAAGRKSRAREEMAVGDLIDQTDGGNGNG